MKPIVLCMAFLFGMAYEIYAQNQENINDLLQSAQQSITADPYSSLELMNRALAIEPKNPHAMSIMGQAYYEIGNIEQAVAYLTRAVDNGNSAEQYYQFSEMYLNQIQNEFGTLRLRVIDRRVDRLSYIEGADITVQYPAKLLSDRQKKRIAFLVSQRGAQALQFTGIDDRGFGYLEVNYFPVLPVESGASYSLFLGENRRYRFNFTEESTDDIAIFWGEEENWKLIERVPVNLIKIEFPNKYRFSRGNETREDTTAQEFSTPQRNEWANLYIPVNDPEIALRLTESREQSSENLWRMASNSIAVIVSLGLLVFAR